MAWDRDKERKAAGKFNIAFGIFGLIFVIFWCIAAASMGAWFMLLFGIPFAGLMGYRLVVMLRMQKERENTPTEPWDRPPVRETPRQNTAGGFCPYCGGTLGEGFQFCPHCGRRLS